MPPPAAYQQRVQLRKAQLLLAWWGNTETVPLAYRYEADDLVVTVPLDREVWTSLKMLQAPDFAYVYLEFDDFVAVQSEQFHWLGGMAPAPSPVNWAEVTVVHFGFRGGASVDVRNGEVGEVSLSVRRPVSKRLRVFDDRGVPINDIALDGGRFWSRNNHCGFPAGLEPLFAALRTNREGVVAVPDGEFEYGFRIKGDAARHASVVEPTPIDEGSFFTAFIDGPELVVRVRRHKRVTLTLRVSIAGKPADGVLIGASSAVLGCGAGTGSLGRTDKSGLLRVPDFYPEEFAAICIGNVDGQPLWSSEPPDDQGEITVNLPDKAEVGDVQVCPVN